MDLPLIGAHCSLPACNELDLLPIHCHCRKLFCRQHIAPESHHCPVDLSHPAENEPQKLQRCSLARCSKLSLDVSGTPTAACPRCHQSFCADHRHPDSHSCQVPTALPEPKNPAARAILEKHASIFKRDTKTPKLSRKSAQNKQVELMRMRHRAVPGNPKDNASSVPLDERVHVNVKVTGNADETEKPFWFRKSIITGKALDLLADHCNISISDTSPVRLFKASNTGPDDRSELRNDQPLATQVDEGSLLFLSQL